VGRHHSLIFLLSCVAGCNAVFDIGKMRGPDSDGDGVSDIDDNCPLAPNEDQANGDGDALGNACDPCDGPQLGIDSDGDGMDDACDPCPEGSNHDEDGDGALDGCDACPADADAGEDADGDGVGDACDPSPGVRNHRVFFDGFGPPRAGWRTWFADWVGRNDGFGPVANGGIGAWNLASIVRGEGWWMEVAVAVPSSPASGDQIGLNLRELPGGPVPQSCLVVYNDRWQQNYWNDAFVTLGSVARFRLRSLGGDAYECTIDGAIVKGIEETPAPDADYLLSLDVTSATDVLWADVVAGADGT
jgi:hypothetical protein